MSSIYEPAEDSYLMSEVLKIEIPRLLKENSELKLLEVGVGSGINLKTLLNLGVNKRNIVGSDINPVAVEHCRDLGFKVILSDLFGNIEGRRFDIIIFNPPYLPLDKKEPKNSRLNTTGGKKGNELIIRFLKQSKRHLTKDGKIFLVTSSLSEDVNFKGLGYKAKEINRKNLFFERLFVWELNLYSK